PAAAGSRSKWTWKFGSASRSPRRSSSWQRARIASGVRSQATACAGSFRLPTLLLLEAAALGLLQLLGIRDLLGVITGGLLGVHLHLRIGGNEFVGDRHALGHLYAAVDDGLELHVAHGDQPVDARDAEPVQHVGHQFLEAHILHAGDAFRALEIGLGPVAALLPLARVVDEELGHLAERPAFLAVVDD